MVKRLPGIAIMMSLTACVAGSDPAEVERTESADSELQGGITITVDNHGMAHVRATNEQLGYAGLCYAMARDRLFQMDVQRRSAQGRLAEIYGPGEGDSIVSIDVFARAQNLQAFAAARYTGASQRTQAILTACATGVNSYIDDATAAGTLPLEFHLLDYDVDPWTPQDCLLAYVNLGVLFDTLTWFTKLERASVSAIAGEDVSTTLIMEAPDVPSMFDAQGGLLPIDDFILSSSPPPTQQATVIPPPPPGTSQGMRNFAPLLRRMAVAKGRASNGFAVDGHVTSTGKPLLASDPHTPLQAPSFIYAAQLEVIGSYNIAGWVAPGFPAFLSGHTQNIAWVPTYTLTDSVDLYVETLRDATGGGQEVFINNVWYPVTTRSETFHVYGQPDVQMTFRTTPHGPIINDGLPGLDVFGTLALKSTSAQPEWKVDGLFELAEATTWSQFKTAALKQGIGLNFVFADYAGTHGHIGYQNSGLAPQRESSLNALYPVPGSGGYEWTDYATNAELPSAYDPPSHILGTGNNRIVPRDYAPQGRPVYIANYWDMAWRVQRATTILNNHIQANHLITPQDMASIQLDTQTAIGLDLRDAYVGALGRAGLPTDDPSAAAALVALQQWDGDADAESQGAAVYEMLTFILLRNTVRDVVGPDEYAFFAPSVFITNQIAGLIDVVMKPRAPYFGIDPGATTQEAEAARDAAIRLALSQADAMLRDAMGTTVSEWTWGEIHELAYNHPLAEVDSRFEIGTFAGTGDPGTINIGGWFARIGNLDLPAADFAAAGGVWGALTQDALSSARFVWNGGSLDGSLGVMSTGFSGDPRTNHYSDHAQPWRQGQIYQLPFTHSAIGN